MLFSLLVVFVIKLCVTPLASKFLVKTVVFPQPRNDWETVLWVPGPFICQPKQIFVSNTNNIW